MKTRMHLAVCLGLCLALGCDRIEDSSWEPDYDLTGGKMDYAGLKARLLKDSAGEVGKTVWIPVAACSGSDAVKGTPGGVVFEVLRCALAGGEPLYVSGDRAFRESLEAKADFRFEGKVAGMAEGETPVPIFARRKK